MLKRILTAGILIPVLILFLIFSHTVAFPILWMLVALISVYEMSRALGFGRDLLVSVPAYPIAGALPFAAYYIRDIYTVLMIVFAAFTFYLLWLFAVAVFRRGKLPFARMTSQFAAILYITVSFLSVSLVRYDIAYGKYLYLLIFIGPWVTDTFAYFTGRFFGRHKLIPEISPKKTVEGAIGGTVFGALSFVGFGLVMQFAFELSVNYVALALSGLLIAFVSQIGDLIASLIKREHGVKDYGNIFPGHGGVLDRFDSVLTTAPAILILTAIGGAFAFLS